MKPDKKTPAELPAIDTHVIAATAPAVRVISFISFISCISFISFILFITFVSFISFIWCSSRVHFIHPLHILYLIHLHRSSLQAEEEDQAFLVVQTLSKQVGDSFCLCILNFLLLQVPEEKAEKEVEVQPPVEANDEAIQTREPKTQKGQVGQNLI